MPIKAKCRKCKKVYTVKDELAGKKFRCKQCQNAVTVPQPAVILEEEPEEDEFASDEFDDFGDDFGDSFSDDFGDDDYEPVRPKKRKKKPVSKKKKRRKKSSGSGLNIGAIFGGVFGFFIILSLIFKVIGAVGGMGGFDLGTSWKPYTTPDGNVTVLMPGTAKKFPTPPFQVGRADSVAPGGTRFGAGRRNFACAITIEPMAGPLAGISENDLFSAFESNSGQIGAQNVKRATQNGKNVIKFEKSDTDGRRSENMAFLHKNKAYTMGYVYKGAKGSQGTKFFNSLKLN